VRGASAGRRGALGVLTVLCAAFRRRVPGPASDWDSLEAAVAGSSFPTCRGCYTGSPISATTSTSPAASNYRLREATESSPLPDRAGVTIWLASLRRRGAAVGRGTPAHGRLPKRAAPDRIIASSRINTKRAAARFVL
jgi:hypothetical protein